MSVAVTGLIKATEPIPGADMIVRADVDCDEHGTWSAVVSKDMKAGDIGVVFLQDALLPEDSRWAFMAKHHHRVKMARFKKVPSECVVLPVEQFPEIETRVLGFDVADLLNVTKYSKPIPANMVGRAKGNFPSFIPKTDEENFQAARKAVAMLVEQPFYITEKADGTSCTAFVDQTTGALRVCSRNWELDEPKEDEPQSVYWQMARKYRLDRLQPGYALQFEIVGPGIQSNRMGLAEIEIRAFSLYDMGDRHYSSYPYLRQTCENLGVPMARLIDEIDCLAMQPSNDELRSWADIKYPNGAVAEGVVVRAWDSSWSFKVINLAYKD